ncbi:hypothetical protein Ahy_B08g090240 isoform B [Arachis hypogaea]|uniref:Uncharacterized protein n=1 Tax=Arachis hypogaea TaxID=3818 RepID=A0A444XZR3_ARAHY|nr:hypothetical protein Ahy_B08g090240 isoform B [Arachis hypogaea]
MDEFSSGDQAPEWTSSSSDDSFSYEDEDSHQDVENIDNVESSIEKDDDKVTATMLWSSEFDKEVHAYKSYVKYARDMGFAVRKRDLSRDKDGNLNRKYYVCNRQGTRDPKHYRLLDRKRNHKPETRTGCKARCFIYLDKLSMKWRVKTLEEEHNHPMIPEQFVHLISNHRKLTEADKARIKFDIDEDHWLLTKYANKAMWATAYLCGKFSAGVRTTSRCEGINSFLKRFIKSQETLLALVENLERVVKEYRNNELVAQFKSMYSKSVLTTGLDSIKQAAARVYTAEVFPEVKDQLAKVVALKHVGKSGMGSNIVHCVAKFRRLGRLYHVLHDDTSERIECECQHSQQSGIPCSHIFCVMRHEDICELPEHLVLKRWRKEANAYLNEEVDDGKDPKRAFALWYGSLWSGSIWMNFLVAKTTPTYRHTIGCVNGIIKDLEKRLCLVENVSRPVKDIQDLEIVKIRGAPKLNKKFKGLKTRNCSRCGQTGHTRRTCHNVESEKHCLTGDNGSEGEGHGSRFETGRHNSHDDDVAAKQGSLSSKFGLYSAGCDEVASDSLKNICKNSIPNYITVPK